MTFSALKVIWAMTQNFSAPRGTSDILSSEVASWQEIEEKARTLFKNYGYHELRTPIFEDTKLFKRSLGQTSEVVAKQLLELVPRSEDEYSLRPEGTASVVRAYIQNNLGKKENLSKVYYMGPMFRGERPQKGRLRQFHQIGVEAIGPDSTTPYLDAEVIALSMNLLKSFGLTGYSLKINTLGSLEDKKNFAKWLRDRLESKISKLSPGHQKSFRENVFRILDSKDENCQALVSQLDLDYSYLSKESQQFFSQVQKSLSALNVPFEVSPDLVRGLDYYTHTVFEISHEGLGSQDALGAGGRYNTLVADLGGAPEENICAVGFSLGVERILLAREGADQSEQESLDVFVIAMDEAHQENAFLLLNEVRRCGLSGDMSYQGGSIKSQMRLSNKLRARYVMILGEEEVKNDCVTFKNMQNGTQEKISLFNLKDTLRKLNR